MDRFEEKVIRTESGCWGWTGKLNDAGYAVLNSGGRFGRPLRAHRVSWETVNGPIPKGLIACHTCDNRSCTNPAHIFIGTEKDNSRDMASKGRQVFQAHPERIKRGSTMHTSKLTESEVLEIRSLRAGGMRLRPIAERFGIAQTTVCAVCSGQNWGHLSSH